MQTWSNRELAVANVKLVGILFLVWPILFVLFFHFACYSNQCSLLTALANFDKFLIGYLPQAFYYQINYKIIKVSLIWIFFQFFLHATIPGPMYSSQINPSNVIYWYKCNGTKCWAVSNFVYLVACLKFNLIEMDFFFKNIPGLIGFCTYLSIFGTLLVYLKALYWPTLSVDCQFSRSVFYDLYMGVELNPRFSIFNKICFDFKQIFNTRTGIGAWTLINLSFVAAQMARNHGQLTNALILVNYLQCLYVVDLFVNEKWYIRTIDMAHDNFGFYLIFGDLVWLPFMYTLQGLYLVYYPLELSLPKFLMLFLIGTGSYIIFRTANNQKDQFRQIMNLHDSAVKVLDPDFFNEDLNKAHELDITKYDKMIDKTKIDETKEEENPGPSIKPHMNKNINESIDTRTNTSITSSIDGNKKMDGNKKIDGNKKMDEFLDDGTNISVEYANFFQILGKPAKYIKARYRTIDGSFQASYLLASGYWGWARHFNYLPDLVNALCYCLCCGFDHLLPYFYFFYMIILLIHRISRDHQRCHQKYGKYWELYCQEVPSKLIPMVY